MKEPEEREFEVDSGASMHMVSKRDFNSAELETVKISNSPTTMMTANGEVQSREEATVYVKELDVFVKVRGSWVFLPLDQRSKTTTHQKRQENWLQYIKQCATRCPWFIDEWVPPRQPPRLLQHLCRRIRHLHRRDSVFWRQQVHGKSRNRKTGSASEELRRNPLHRSTETKNTNKNKGREEVQSDLLHDFPDWLQESRENLVGENCPWEPRGNPAPKDRDTSSSSHESLLESRAKEDPGSGKHGVYTHFPKDPNCDICLKTKIARASCRRRTGTVVPRAEHFGDFISADHKFLSEGSESRNNHRYAVVVQDLATQWFVNPTLAKKTSQEIWSRRENQKSFTLTIPWNLANLVKELTWNHCTSTPRRSETNGIAERAVRRVKEETSAVLLQSGLNNEWWADSMVSYCYLRNIQDLLSDGKSPYERRFGMPLNGTVIPFGAMVEYHSISAKNTSRLHQFVPKSLARYLPLLCLVCGRNLECRYWRIGGDGCVWNPRQKAQSKGSVNADERWQFHSAQSQMEQSKPLEEINFWEHPP